MERSTAQILNGLIPTITGPLPPGLFELAVSLLAQSRSKASSLKADEEIARAYACANIACERYQVDFSFVICVVANANLQIEAETCTP